MSKMLLPCCVVLFSLSAVASAEAARCPLGEIYRPSRGVCVSKSSAIHAGIYRGGARREITRAAPIASETPVSRTRTARLEPRDDEAQDAAPTRSEARDRSLGRTGQARAQAQARDDAPRQDTMGAAAQSGRATPPAASPYGSFDRNPDFDRNPLLEAAEARMARPSGEPLAYAPQRPALRSPPVRVQSVRSIPVGPAFTPGPSPYGHLIALEPTR